MHKPYDTHLIGPADKSEHIRILNDAFRTDLSPIGPALARNKLYITRGIADRGHDFTNRAVQAVREFSDFTEDNDPHGEHDFGSFELDGIKLFWKIDYYDQNLDMGSPDPADHTVTTRVLTIFMADEY
jgi:hypothetical protein